jgi:acyl-CoA synthetase (AMP-forming)/AMP-acid ligase II
MCDELTIDSVAARAVPVPMPRRPRTAAGDVLAAPLVLASWCEYRTTVMKGYWNLAAFGADAVVGEWFSTVDIGWVDEDGHFFLCAQQDLSIGRTLAGLRACKSRPDCFPRHRPGFDVVAEHIDSHRRLE